MNTPQWVVLKDPVPPVVTARAVELLHELALGNTRVERVDVDCATITAGRMTQILQYVCETHDPVKNPHKGITVYGLL